MSSSRRIFVKFLRRLLRISPFFVGTLLLLFLLRKLDWLSLRNALYSSNWPLAFLASFLNLTALTLCRTQRFRTLIRNLPCHGEGVQFLELMVITVATRALSLVLPAKAGETLR